MSVKAKFSVRHIEAQEGYLGKTIYMSAVIDDSEENKEWSKHTPSGEISMHVTNPAALDKFEQGKEYYVTFEKVGE